MAEQGNIPWNKGVKTGRPAWNRGISPSASTRAKQAAAHIGNKAWNNGLTKDDPRIAAMEAKRRSSRTYTSKGGRSAALDRYAARVKERDPLGLGAREKRARYAARRAGIYAELVDYRLVIERDGWGCAICGQGVLPDDLSFDHTQPFCQGGEHVFENVRVSHLLCNMRKGETEGRVNRIASVVRANAARKRGR